LQVFELSISNLTENYQSIRPKCQSLAQSVS